MASYNSLYENWTTGELESVKIQLTGEDYALFTQLSPDSNVKITSKNIEQTGFDKPLFYTIIGDITIFDYIGTVDTDDAGGVAKDVWLKRLNEQLTNDITVTLSFQDGTYMPITIKKANQPFDMGSINVQEATIGGTTEMQMKIMFKQTTPTLPELFQGA